MVPLSLMFYFTCIIHIVTVWRNCSNSYNIILLLTSLPIAYDGPRGRRGPSQATRLSKHKNFVSCTKSLFPDGIFKRKTTRQTWLECNVASASDAVRKKSCSCRGPSQGRFLKDDFSHGAISLKKGKFIPRQYVLGKPWRQMMASA